MLDYTSKRLLDKLLNKVWLAGPGVKSPVLFILQLLCNSQQFKIVKLNKAIKTAIPSYQ